MNRRTFISASAIGLGALAGCSNPLSQKEPVFKVSWETGNSYSSGWGENGAEYSLDVTTTVQIIEKPAGKNVSLRFGFVNRNENFVDYAEAHIGHMAVGEKVSKKMTLTVSGRDLDWYEDKAPYNDKGNIWMRLDVMGDNFETVSSANYDP